MVSASRIGIIGGTAIVVLGGLWIGAAAVSSRQVEPSLAALMDKPLYKAGAWSLTNLHHQAGMISSSGSFDITFSSPSLNQGQGSATLATLEYRISHLPTPFSLNRYHWSLRPAGESAADIKKNLGDDFHLEGDGSLSYGGKVGSSLKLSEVTIKDQTGSLHMAPMTGSMSVDKATAALSLLLPNAELTVNDETSTLKNLAMQVDILDVTEGTGKELITLDSFSGSKASAEGLKLTGEAHDHGDRRDSAMGFYVASGQAVGGKVKDLALELSIRDVDIQAIHQLQDALKSLQAAGAGANPDQTLAVMKPSLVRILQQGLTYDLSRISGSVTLPDGSQAGLDFKAVATLAPMPASGMSLAQQLSSKGNARLTGNALPAPMKQMAVLQGFALADGDALTAQYELKDGKLNLNGKDFDPSTVNQALAMAQMQLAMFLAGTP